MAAITQPQSMEIHIRIANTAISGIVQGTGYNPDVYNDLMANTMKALEQSLTIAITHGYAFPDEDTIEDDENEDEDEDGDD